MWRRTRIKGIILNSAQLGSNDESSRHIHWHIALLTRHFQPFNHSWQIWIWIWCQLAKHLHNKNNNVCVCLCCSYLPTNLPNALSNLPSQPTPPSTNTIKSMLLTLGNLMKFQLRRFELLQIWESQSFNSEQVRRKKNSMMLFWDKGASIFVKCVFSHNCSFRRIH